jgi:hypothetical protein
MSCPLPRPSASAGASDRASSYGKMSAPGQRILKQAKILDEVNKSCAPASRSHVQNHTTPATPSSVNCANRYNQRNSEKLLKQPPIVFVAAVVAIPIPKLASIQGHNTDKGEGTIPIILPRKVPEEPEEAPAYPATEETDAHIDPATEETDAHINAATE